MTSGLVDGMGGQPADRMIAGLIGRAVKAFVQSVPDAFVAGFDDQCEVEAAILHFIF